MKSATNFGGAASYIKSLMTDLDSFGNIASAASVIITASIIP